MSKSKKSISSQPDIDQEEKELSHTTVNGASIVGDDEQKLEHEQKENEKKEDKSKISRFSPETYQFEKSCAVWFSIFFLIYAIATIVSFAMILAFTNDQSGMYHAKLVANYVYHIALIIYQIAVILVSCWSLFRLKSLPKIKVSPIPKTWYELVFYIKFALCSVFNLIAGVLLIYGVHRPRNDDDMKPIWILMAISYLINAMSIPFPGIALFEYLNTKNSIVSAPVVSRTASRRRHSASRDHSRNNISVPLLSEKSNNLNREISTDTQSVISLKRSMAKPSISVVSTSPTSSAKLNVRQNVFNNKCMLAGISCAYFMHFLYYVLSPVFIDNFNGSLKVMYIENNQIYDILYTINHVVLRTFKGMSLNGLFFVFFVAVIAKDQERYSQEDKRKTDWQYVKILLKNNRLFWVWLFMIIIISLGLDVFCYVFEALDGKHIIDSVWIGIHIVGVIIAIVSIDRFKGAYDKYTKPFFNRFGGGKIVDNISYGFKALILFILFTIQVVVLLDEGNLLEWCRILSMLVFGALQMVTLVLLRAIQSNDEYIRWSNKNNRKTILKWVYFRFLVFVNISDLLFVYIFGYQYYSQDKLQDPRIGLSYAVSFSGGAIFTICVAQIMISYAEFDYLFTNYTSETKLETEMSVSGKSNKNATTTFFTAIK